MISLKDALKDGTDGVYHLRGGEVGHTFGIWEDDEFLLRYEHGWYTPYRDDGTQIVAGVICHPDGTETVVQGTGRRDIVGFERISWEDAFLKYGEKLTGGFHP